MCTKCRPIVGVRRDSRALASGVDPHGRRWPQVGTPGQLTHRTAKLELIKCGLDNIPYLKVELLLVTPVSEILVFREELGKVFDRFESFRIYKTISPGAYFVSSL